MSLSFQSQLEIAAPPERVFAAMTDVDGMGNWMQNFVRVERLTPGEVAVGSQFRETRRMFGREATEHFEVTALEPGRRFGLRVDGAKGSSGKGEYRFDYHFEPTATGTRITTQAEIDMPGGFFVRMIGRIFLGTFRKACDKDLLALKSWVEGQGAASNA